MLVSSPERQNSLLLPKLVFGACPVLAVLGGLSLLEHLQIPFKLSLPNWDSHDWPLRYSTWPRGRVIFILENPSALVNNSCHTVGTAQRPRVWSRFDSLSSRCFKGRRIDMEETFQNNLPGIFCLSWWLSGLTCSSSSKMDQGSYLIPACISKASGLVSYTECLLSKRDIGSSIKSSQRLGNGHVFLKLDFHQRGLNVEVNRCCIVKSCCG